MDIHKIIGNLPRPKKGFVLPSHKYTGPYNPLDEQLDETDTPVPGQEPFNAIDAISMRHDICYRDHGSTKSGKHVCDDDMLYELEQLEPKNIREKIDKGLVKSLIGAKRKLGLGIEWSDSLTDELHKPVRKRFKKRKVFAKKANDIWAADLVDMQYFARGNKGYKYILMIIDVFSKYGWAIPLKTKTGVEVAKAFSDLWSKEKAPKYLWTDKGKEFINANMDKVLAKHNVQIYWTENEEKSSVVERWNRTIKQWMWKYFTKQHTGTYIDILPQLIEKYNSTYHRSIKCTPSDARKTSNHQQVFNALYGGSNKFDENLRDLPKFHVGDQVRITKKKNHFEKGYTTNWRNEVFIVTEVQPTYPYTYKLDDTRGEKVIGTFYEPELQLAKQTIFTIEKVLRRRTTKEGKKELYVKWKGYSKDFNQWIPVEDVEK